MTIYADIYALINALCDLTVLSVSAWVLRRRTNIWRQFFSAMLGGLFALASLYISANILPLLSVFCAICMVLIAFGYRNFKSFLSAILSFYLISALMGGLTEGVLSLFQKTLSPMPALLLLTIMLTLSAGVTLFAGRAFIRRCAAGRAELFFLLEEKEYTVSAFCDSGNLVTDPESGLPVIFLSHELLPSLPQNTRTLHAVTVSGEVILPLCEPQKLTVNGEERAAVLALAENSSFDGALAMIPNILLT